MTKLTIEVKINAYVIPHQIPLISARKAEKHEREAWARFCR